LIALVTGEPRKLTSPWVVGAWEIPEVVVVVVEGIPLLRIFPRLDSIMPIDEGWEKVENAINRSRRTIDCSSKQPPLTTR